ncbi:hypothetical protein PIB30_078011 [Stylosanthes scabra]|uniref:Uncharacterized protein n=1 Tax=Stylosanthes scabra TaxID=79078 RepID=A0ABU6RQZ5_9FABA|nr:hypothetical protein [Stylosanthes scabra]
MVPNQDMEVEEIEEEAKQDPNDDEDFVDYFEVAPPASSENSNDLVRVTAPNLLLKCHRGATKFENTEYWTRVVLPGKAETEVRSWSRRYQETNHHRVAELTFIRRGIAVTTSKLTLFLPSIALRDRQLSSFTHFTPQPSHYGHYSLLFKASKPSLQAEAHA